MTVGEWTVLVQHALPELLDDYRHHASLAEEIGLSAGQGRSCFVAAGRSGSAWPELVVAQRYQPAGYGFDPGVALVPQTGVLFVGAGERLLGYELAGNPRRLWEDTADVGFWHWSVHDSVVLMAAELELAAWDPHGRKLWTTFVEPPWDYAVEGKRLRLDVMGKVSEFALADGPPR